MKWSLSELKKHRGQPIAFDLILDLKSEIMARSGEVLDLTSVAVQGSIESDAFNYLLNYQVSYQITLASSRSLTPVVSNEHIEVAEIFVTKDVFDSLNQEDEMVLVLEKDLIDLDESVSDNILLNIPSKILTPDEEKGEGFISGESWEVLTELDYQQKQQSNPKKNASPFSNLDKIFSENPK
ncbi:MAG: YceD family protein [Streptococcaceae bacterium]|jgi:uncharacterized protein|nr:YceD family protein [Streptococcaceae bacterium]